MPLMLVVGVALVALGWHHNREDALSNDNGHISESRWRTFRQIAQQIEQKSGFSIYIQIDTPSESISVHEQAEVYREQISARNRGKWGGILFLSNGDCRYLGSADFEAIGDSLHLESTRIAALEAFDASGLELGVETFLVNIAKMFSHYYGHDINDYFLPVKAPSLFAGLWELFAGLVLLLLSLAWVFSSRGDRGSQTPTKAIAYDYFGSNFYDHKTTLFTATTGDGD